MLFAYAVRGIYIESCAMFVLGGVYRVVKEAMGGTLAKLSVSALMFDYVLTGPISGVSAGQYIVGLANELLHLFHLAVTIPTAAGSAAIAVAITLYFWHQNILGIEESSDKAMKIMRVTTVMVVVMLAWCGATLWQRGATLPPFELHLSDEALGWLGGTEWGKRIGALGILIAFGHSILAMSGEESLAQVNREIAHSKVPNLIRAGLVIFVFTMLTTGLVGRRSDNRIDEGGLPSAAVRSTADHGVAMRNHPLHPYFARLCAQRGYTMAVVAVAHRLCRILFALLRDGAEFDLAKLAVEEGPFRRTSVQRYRREPLDT